jgi:hypothetical protein
MLRTTLGLEQRMVKQDAGRRHVIREPSDYTFGGQTFTRMDVEATSTLTETHMGRYVRVSWLQS